MPVKTINLDQPAPPKNKPTKTVSPKSNTSGFKIWLTKHRRLVTSCGLICMVLAAATAYVVINSQASSPVPQQTVKTTPTPTPEIPTIPNPLNGVLYTKAEAEIHANRRPLAVMVENHIESRPQAGLSQAEIIYEAMAEGGITRFMAMYLHNETPQIGPIRSARLHYVNWAAEYDAAYAHWGGSSEALAYLQNHNRPQDIDQFYNAAAFYRDYAGGRSLEHTGYSSTEALRQVVNAKGLEELPTFKSWQFKNDIAQADRPASQAVTVDFLGNNGYKGLFDYRPLTNDYARSTAGAPHLDSQGQQLSAKAIVFQFQNVLQFTDNSGHPAVDVTTTGSGQAVIIQDGAAIEGTWSKTAANVRTSFTDANGKDIPLNRGLIWVVSVPIGSNYSY